MDSNQHDFMTVLNCAEMAVAAHKEYVESTHIQLDKETFIKGFAAAYILIEDKFRTEHGIGMSAVHSLLKSAL